MGQGSWKHLGGRRVLHSFGSIDEVHGWNVCKLEMERHSKAKSPPAMHACCLGVHIFRVGPDFKYCSELVLNYAMTA